ncbi:MAG: hypothetical protein QOD99_1180, partial [Chthoniobacter sp.]|nr:hypothetical protein [Chthoniobacter sp.]
SNASASLGSTDQSSYLDTGDDFAPFVFKNGLNAIGGDFQCQFRPDSAKIKSPKVLQRHIDFAHNVARNTNEFFERFQWFWRSG